MKYFAGIDLGGTFVKLGIVDENGKILARNKFPTGKERPNDEVIRDMANGITAMEKDNNLKTTAVGIGIPGITDSENATVVFADNLGWKNVEIGKKLSSLLDKPVFACNDASAAALGEYFCGTSKNYLNSALITLGTGVGSGFIINGKLYEGFKSAGGEFGHTVIKVNGEKCACGRKGCFEAYASTSALIRQTEKALNKDEKKESLLWKLTNNDLTTLNGVTIEKAVSLGDKLAKRVWNKYASYVSEGVINLANILRPEIILIGGGISGAGELLLKPIRRKVNRTLKDSVKYAPIKIETASLLNDAGLLGAVKFAIDSLK